MTYDWAYLCNNPRRLAITLRCLPREPFAGLCFMNICWCSHLDPTTRVLELIDTANTHAPDWLAWQLTDLSPLRRHLPAGLAPYWDTGKTRWSLGMKLLLPYAFPGPYLYTDDDVVVPHDPAPLMTNSFGSKGCFRFAGKKRAVQEDLLDAFNLPRTLLAEQGSAWYDAHALDAGVWFHLNPGDWKARLERFAQMPYLAALTTRNLELRCLDQRFLTGFGLAHGWDRVTIRNGFAPPRWLRDSFFNAYFIHYKSQSKDAWMKLLEAYLDSR